MTKWMGVLVAAVALCVAASPALAAGASDVMVVRGTEVTGPVDSRVEESRGPGSVDEAPAQDPAIKVSRLSPSITAGRTLWMVDPDQRKIVSCKLCGSLTAGKKRVRCFTRTFRTGGANPFGVFNRFGGMVYQR